MQDDQEDAPDLNTRQKVALTARVERLEAALREINENGNATEMRVIARAALRERY